MKKGLVIGFVLILLSSFAVIAGTCDDDQTIMRLYSEKNSHVSFWNEGVADYTVEICYNEIFGSPYTGANPHDCTGENRVLSLFDVKNSHAASTTDSNYNNEVCYGKLECVYDSSDNDECSNDGEIVARMYSEYNSHVSVASNTNYDVKVCCKASNAYWADMNGDKITEADFGDTVQMIMTSTSDISDFEIFEEDALFNDPIRTLTGEIVDGNLIGTWTIIQEDLDKTNDYDNFKFTVNGETSEDLKINLNSDDDPIDVTILSPACGLHFDEGKIIGIVISASDADDIIDGTITIDGDVVETFSNEGITFSKIFSSSGNSQIVVEAVNDRGKRTRAISNIMILEKNGENYVDGKYVAACIAKPKDYSNIEGSVVEFDASTTRGVRITDGVFDLLVPDEGDIFSWYWRFMPENIIRELIQSSESIAYRFTAEFPIAGDNSATLRVEID